VAGSLSEAAAVFTTGDVTAPNTQFKQYQLDLWDGANAPSSEVRLDTIVLHAK
jgi:hypothetical protein